MSSMRTNSLPVATAVLLICASAAAQSAPGSPALHWSRDASAGDCVDPRTLAQLVEGYTGPVFVPPAQADVSIEGSIQRTGQNGFRVRVAVTGRQGGPPGGERVLELTAVECRKLDGALAFVIATALDPDLNARGLPAELDWLQSSELPAAEQLRAELTQTTPTTSAAVPAAIEPKPTAAPALATEPPAVVAATGPEPDERLDLVPDWELGLALQLGSGLAPVASAGGMLTLTHGFGSWFALSLQARGNAGLLALDVVRGYTVGAQAYALAPQACARSFGRSGFGFQGCLGPELGWLRVVGDGFSHENAVLRSSFGASLRLELRYALTHSFALTGGAVLGLELTRPEVNYRDLEDEHIAVKGQTLSALATVGLTHSF